MSDKIKTAVVTGRHGFDVVGFTEMFRALPTVDPYIQHMEHFCADPGRDAYDVILFYHMITEGPTDAQRQGLEGILDNGQGLFILHHAILGWPEWAEYSELVGIGDRSFDTDMGQNLPVDVATPDHPITRDLPSTWQIEDETYSMAVAAGSDGNEVLLTTEHEASMDTATRAFACVLLSVRPRQPRFCQRTDADGRAAGYRMVCGSDIVAKRPHSHAQ